MDDLEPLRHQAIRVLSTAVAAERMPVEQFESRLALVRQAPNRATLDAIVADLLPTGGFTPPAGLVRAASDHTAVAPVAPAEYLRIACVFGTSKRAGSWTVPLHLDLKVVCGDLTIDLRDAVFGSDLVDIEVHAVMGNITLVVPAGAQVENEIEERFSASSHSTRGVGGAAPIGLLIRLAGRTVFSNLDVKEKLRSESAQPPG